MSRVTRKIVRTAKQWAALTATEKAANRRGLEILSIMRDEGIPATPASKRVGSTVATARKYVSPALRRDARGRIVAKPTDRLFRRLSILTTQGIKEVDTTNFRVASDAGRHWNAIGHYLGTGNDRSLRVFRGKKISGHTLETDPDVIERQANRGELDFEGPYDLTR